MKKYLFMLALLLLPSLAWGEPIECTKTNIETSIAALPAEGGTVQCDGTPVTWSSNITVNQDKPILFDGNGTTVTIGNGVSVLITSYQDKLIEIKNFAFTSAYACAIWFAYESGCAAESCGNVLKIHGNTITSTSNTALIGPIIKVNNGARGVIYNNTFTGKYLWSLIQYTPGAVTDCGYYEWQNSPSLGTDKFLFVEGNTITMTHYGATGGAILDGRSGNRYVARYNTIKNNYIGHHDNAEMESNGSCAHRGTRAYEIYNNDFSGTIGYHAIAFRGGTGVIYNNYSRQPDYNNTSFIYHLSAYRDTTHGAHTDGINTPYDDLTTADGQPSSGNCVVSSTTYVFDATDVNKYVYVYDGGAGWTSGVWHQITAVDGSGNATLDTNDLGFDGAKSDGEFYVHLTMNTWEAKCGDAIAEKMCAQTGVLCYGTGDGDCAEGDGPCVLVDNPISARSETQPLCRDQIGAGTDNATTYLQPSDPTYMWNNYYCLGYAGLSLATADGDPDGDTGCTVSSIQTTWTSNISADWVGKNLFISAASPWISDNYTIVSVDTGAKSVVLDRACAADGAATSAVWYVSYYDTLSSCTGGTPTALTYARTVATANQDIILDTKDIIFEQKPGYTPYQCPHPLATEYAGYTCDTTKYGTEGYPGNASSGASASIGSGAAMSIGSGAVMTLQ